jgi:acid phosphatase type 7
VTWSTAPPAASSPTATIGSVSSGTWITVDVTAFVQGDGVVSLRISSTNSNGADYTSRQGTASNAPELVVTTS